MEAYVGHAPGGVCPFGVNEGVAVYLDESLRKFDTVYPAAGNGHTAVKLTLQELEAAAGAEAGWMFAKSRKANKRSIPQDCCWMDPFVIRRGMSAILIPYCRRKNC